MRRGFFCGGLTTEVRPNTRATQKGWLIAARATKITTAQSIEFPHNCKGLQRAAHGFGVRGKRSDDSILFGLFETTTTRGIVMEQIIEFLARWGHGLFGVTWIGFLYYFNFVQGGYFKKASPEALADAKAHLAPAALWWFRWGAMFTFLTGAYLWYTLGGTFNSMIAVGAVMGTLMFLNVWLIIWPNQKIALGMVEGDAAAAGGKALLASRTNTLFSGPMLMGMLASKHVPPSLDVYWSGSDGSSTGLIVALILVALLEINAIVGKQGPMTSVKGVIVSSLVLSAVMMAVLACI